MKFIKMAALLAAIALCALHADASDGVSIRGKRSYLITVIAGKNGKVSPSKRTTALSGTTKTFVVTPNKGYLIDSLTVNGAPQKGLPTRAGKAFTLNLKNIKDNLTISAAFASSRTVKTLSVGSQVSVVDAKK